MLFIFIAVPCQAGWTPAERISDENTVYNPRIAANGQSIHVAYSSWIGANIPYYVKSDDNGLTWSEPYLMIDTSINMNGVFPLIKTSGDSVFSIWKHNIRNSSHKTIAFRRSLDNGDHWQPIVDVIQPRDYILQKHAMSISGRNVFIAFSYNDDNYDLVNKFIKSANGGQTWSEPEELLRLYDADQMDMACRGDTIFLVWAGRYGDDDTWESYYMKSNNAGDSWSDAILLSEPDTIGSHHPSISINDTGEIVVCWCDGKFSPNPWNGDLFVRYSYDMGETWTDEEQIYFNHWAAFPRVVWQGDSIHVVWQDDDIWGSIDYMLSPDNGLTWEDQQRLDNDTYFSTYPDLAINDSSTHVVWGNNIDTGPGSGIYYSRWEPEVSVPELIPLDYNTTLVSYPNPFNSTTRISYSNIEGGDIEIYDIRGRLVNTLVLGDCQEGSVIWDGTDVSGNTICSGIYFAKTRTSQGYTSMKLVFLK